MKHGNEPSEATPTLEPGGQSWEADDVWLDGSPYDPSKSDPFDESRLPEDEGPPYPAGLTDPLSHELVDSARYLLRWILHGFWSSPRWMMWVGSIWHWRKFEFLDWLRPLELLLRRLVMIEALSLLASQVLPRRKPRAGKAAVASDPAVRKQKLVPVYDPDHPECWRVSFTVIPSAPQPGRKRYPPNPEIRRFHVERYNLGFEKTSSRYRRVLHPALPLAKRLEAVIRVVVDPAPFARRAAFRLRARANLNADLLLMSPRKPKLRLASDALQSARDRLAELFGPIWEQYRSSA